MFPFKKKKTVFFIRFYIKFDANKNCNISGFKWFPVSPKHLSQLDKN